MIKVLIVDDSPTVVQYLSYMLNEDSAIEVTGTARNGREAIDFVAKSPPDIITMDVDMPKMGGIDAIKRIMTTTPIPIIVVTSKRNSGGKDISIEALSSGALTVLQKPLGMGHDDSDEYSKKLLYLIKSYAQVKVIKRNFLNSSNKSSSVQEKKDEMLSNTIVGTDLYQKKYIAIGISTGGPKVLEQILSKITEGFPYPILIVQHITAGFLEYMVAWLNRLLSIPVHIAKDNELPVPGHVYFAPDNYHLGMNLNRLSLEKRKNQTEICPSAHYLFTSLAQNNAKDTIAMILTGMGSDGAKGIKELKEKGAVTIAQDKKSSLIHGMPGVAIQNGAINHVMSTCQITELLLKIEKEKR